MSTHYFLQLDFAVERGWFEDQKAFYYWIIGFVNEVLFAKCPLFITNMTVFLKGGMSHPSKRIEVDPYGVLRYKCYAQRTTPNLRLHCIHLVATPIIVPRVAWSHKHC